MVAEDDEGGRRNVHNKDRDQIPVDEQVHQIRVRQRVRSAIDDLPGRVAETMRALYVDDLSHEEAALKLGITVKELRNRLKTGKRLLRDSLSDGVADDLVEDVDMAA